MTTDLRDLYQQVILDHQRSPRNFGEMPEAHRTAEGHNPLCGDQVTVFLKIEGDVVTDVHFQGVGCAICMASASMMTEHVKGKPLDEIEEAFCRFHALLTEAGEAGNGASLGKLEVFAGVREFPIRVKCATLPWHVLQAALAGSGELVSTE